MAKTFVIGIGGSGSRIIRSLMVLLTAGVDTNNHEIIPLIIDIDATNEDTDRTFKLVEEYYKFREKLYPNNIVDQQEKLLNTRIGKLNENTEIKDNKFNFPDVSDMTFSKFIGYEEINSDDKSEKMDELNKDFLRSLFDDTEDELEGELHLKMNLGFKGRPNIGCIIFDNIKDKSEFRDILNQSASSEGNKIFIVSSIFGGTGASGFPQLLNIIEDAPNNGTNARIKNVPIGGLSVLPYFNVSSESTDGDNSIQSNKFITKSKSALYYYENKLNRLNAMYYLYDKAMNNYENNSGGDKQKNNAHWIELIGAYSILKFIKSSINATETKSYAYYAAYDESNEDTLDDIISYKNFYKNTQNDILDPLIKLYITYAICKQVKKDILNKITYIVTLNLDEDKEERRYLDYIINFFETHIIPWLKELQLNERKLNLFNLDTSEIKDILNFCKVEKTPIKHENYDIFLEISTKLFNDIVKENIQSKNLSPTKRISKFLEIANKQIFALYKIEKI